MPVHVFGIRHHGPGSARSLRAALDQLAPDAVLIEGPPDANDALGALRDPGLVPPVALLVYEPGAPRNASYYPFTHFSPEWQALRWAIERGVEAAFMDLPVAHRLGLDARSRDDEDDDHPTARQRIDPLGVLAEAAGYDDGELWWEQQVEARRDAAGMFEAIAGAMAAVRAECGHLDEDDALREAYMRKVIRATVKAGRERVAVVCGAWHAPALIDMPPAKADSALLKGLPRTKISCTWIPWTTSRLSFRSGYGAGVDSPGWYGHLWDQPERAAVRWTTLAARLLREQDLDASSASVIEAVRLAEALASLRDLAAPGLREMREAIQTVLCHGEAAPMALIRTKLEIGESLGQVPASVDTVPLQRDLEAQQKRLRLKASAEIRVVELDLRKDNDLERSKLLHRLSILGLPWGTRVEGTRTQGTFRESWQLEWRPELAVALIEANVWGNTIVGASTARLAKRAEEAELTELTELLDAAVLADLPEGIDALLAQLQARAALSSDVGRMMRALEPLARIIRYSDVRQTAGEAVRPILHGLFERALVGLPGACAHIDDDAARELVGALNATHTAVTLLDDAGDLDEWREALRRLLAQSSAHGLVRGRGCRLLVELGGLDEDELGRQTSLALSTATDPLQAGAWVQGLLEGSGLLLVHQQAVWVALDAWLRHLSRDGFLALLPLIRRGFSEFSPAERRTMSHKVRRLDAVAQVAPAVAVELDEARAARVLPVLSRILGAEP